LIFAFRTLGDNLPRYSSIGPQIQYRRTLQHMLRVPTDKN